MSEDWREEFDKEMGQLDEDLDALAGKDEPSEEGEEGEDREGGGLDAVPPALLGAVVIGIGGYYLGYFGPVAFLVIVLLGAFAPQIQENGPDAWTWLKRQFTPMSKREDDNRGQASAHIQSMVVAVLWAGILSLYAFVEMTLTYFEPSQSLISGVITGLLLIPAAVLFRQWQKRGVDTE